LRLSFTAPPPLRTSPVWIQIPRDAVKAQALRQEVFALVQKNAVEEITSWNSPGFYSHVFVVPKPGGKWRPVIDLSSLNTFLLAPKFRMETARAVRASVQPGDFAISVDLTDAYLHVPIHASAKKFLRFAIDDHVYAFRALPFGLNLSPWVFTRLMDAVMLKLRQKCAAEISNYLDDLLMKHQSQQALRVDREVMLETLRTLGWMVNIQKSDLEPSQDFVHLGMRFQTDKNLVSLTERRCGKLWEAVTGLLQKDCFTPRDMHSVLGMCSAAAELIQLGRVQLRSLQWAAADVWSPISGDWDTTIAMSADLRRALSVWLNKEWLLSGVPLRSPPPSMTLCTDASAHGWGAHLLPSFQTLTGTWSVTECTLHINLLEMMAVINAVRGWAETLRGSSLMLMSDNMSVVAYVKHQEAHTRKSCAAWLATCGNCVQP
jgi:hypothetical protein